MLNLMVGILPLIKNSYIMIFYSTTQEVNLKTDWQQTGICLICIYKYDLNQDQSWPKIPANHNLSRRYSYIYIIVRYGTKALGMSK